MEQPTTRLQISGYRFMVRRMEHALVRGDIRMLDDPLRAQSLSLVAGAVLAVIAVAICAVLAFVRPGGDLGDALIVVVRESGAMYVRIDDVMHPVFNLASARLVVGSAAEPRLVSQRAIDRAGLGLHVGIPGAPEQISPPLNPDEAIWTLCDDRRSGTTAVAGPVDVSGMADGSVLVTPRGESAAVTYLLYGGWRARVDLRHPAVVRALRLDSVVPQKISPSILAAIPEAPAIEPPRIPGRGGPAPAVFAGHPVGTVLTARDRGGAEADYYVVLGEGLQRIDEVAADLIRYTDGEAAEQVPTVSADVIGAAPVATSLPVWTYPRRGGVSPAPAVCAQWRPTRDETGSHTAILTGDDVPRAVRSVALAQADGEGPAVDTVSIPAGRSVYVRSVGLTGAGQSAGSLFLVTDSGVVHGVSDSEAAAALGLSVPAVPAPWPVLATLPRGQELSRERASLARDGIGAPA